MAKIISLGGDIPEQESEEEYTPEKILESMKGKLDKIVLFGIDKDDHPVFASSVNLHEAYMMLSAAKQILMDSYITYNMEEHGDYD